MKLKTIAAAATLAALAPAAFAQTYAGIAVGATNACLESDNSGNCPHDAANVKATIGYTWPGTDFAIEGIVDHLGAFRQDGAFGRSQSRADTLGIGGAWRPQWGAGWGGVLRAGVDYGQVRMSAQAVPGTTGIPTGSWSRTNGSWQPYLGAGVTYALTSSVSLEADLDLTRLRAGSTGSTTAATSMNVGVNFKF